MKIFITGGSGFLGTKLQSQLEVDGHEIYAPSSKTCNLLEQNALSQINYGKFDQIFHLAAWTQAGDFCLKYPCDQWILNQKINTNVLDWWVRSQPQAKLIIMGTSCAYPTNLKLSEENYMLGEPIESLYTYAMTKRMLLQGAKAAHKQYGLSWLCAVPSTLYGAEYHTDDRQMHFIFDLIRKIIRGKYLNEKVELWGNGNQRREIVHVKDFINALLKINQKEKNIIINIGSGIDYSIKEFANKVCNAVDYDSRKIIYDESKYTGAQTKLLDINLLKSLYDISSFRSIDDGIREVVDWYRNIFLMKS